MPGLLSYFQVLRMSKPFDAALKHLLEAFPADWPRFLGLPFTGQVRIVDADVSTVTAQADKVLRIEDAAPWILHLELQASHDAELSRRMLRYNVLLTDRHRVPVHSVVVLLRPQADGGELTGSLVYQLPTVGRYLEFHYQVVRLWQQPVEAILAGGIGTLPLAPLANVSPGDLPRVVRRVGERLSQGAKRREAEELWAATYVLMGLRHSPGLAAELIGGARAMEESVTYQAIVEKGVAKGAAQEARKFLLLQGRKRFGRPDRAVRATLESIVDLHHLERLGERLLDVKSWEELLSSGPPRRRNGRRKSS